MGMESDADQLTSTVLQHNNAMDSSCWGPRLQKSCTARNLSAGCSMRMTDRQVSLCVGGGSLMVSVACLEDTVGTSTTTSAGGAPPSCSVQRMKGQASRYSLALKCR